MSQRRNEEAVRRGCEGVVPLRGRLDGWQLELLAQPSLLAESLDRFGSPLNLLNPGPMEANVAELRAAAAAAKVPLDMYFARKANKCLTFVDEARRLGLGLDLASEAELCQALDRGVPGTALIVTAAVKPAALLDRCVASEALVALDNADELARLAAVADAHDQTAAVALRLCPALGANRSASRFGFSHEEAVDAGRRVHATRLRIDGVHFHVDGYAPIDRVSAIRQSLELVDALREQGHDPSFVDIGGGVPISYVPSAAEWERFWAEHRRALLGQREPLTFEGHGLGQIVHSGEVVGTPNVYPFHQALVGGAWLSQILGSSALPGDTTTIAEALRMRRLGLRCEPGRALVNGCGLTAARVAFRKRRPDGTSLIGLEMNRTQCRSTSEDFLVDPILVKTNANNATASATEGFLVGAYCIEREFITWRRLRFPHGVEVGDIVVFPNTAGYQMHILESRAHQMPLAANVLVGPGTSITLDPIDAGELR